MILFYYTEGSTFKASYELISNRCMFERHAINNTIFTLQTHLQSSHVLQATITFRLLQKLDLHHRKLGYMNICIYV